MTTRFRAAAVQMSSGENPDENLAAATALIESAVAGGARLVVLPETFVYMGPPAGMVASAETIPGPTSQRLCELARRLAITLVAGSYCERSPDATKAFNTSLLIGADGAILAKYRKRHLFDLEIAGQVNSRESSWLLPGEATCVTVTEHGHIGQAICYDLRFPELFRRMIDADCNVLCLPAAFTLATGRDHWETLLRARAIENQAYVIAANQFGRHAAGMTTYGRSMIIDPWGTVLSTAHDGAGIVLAEIDLARVDEIRARLPALAHRQLR